MKQNAVKMKIFASLWWSFLQRTGVQLIQLVITLLLARLLLPEDFGLIVIVTVLNTFAIVIVQSGFTTALIQKKSIDQLDLSSVFYVHIASSAIIIAILHVVAPIVAQFFDEPLLTNIIRLLSWSLLFSAYHSIQYVIISRNLQFKELFTTTFIAHIVAGLIGLYLAIAGYGVYALVVQQLMSYIINPLVLLLYVKWLPTNEFCGQRIVLLFSFGWKLLVAAIIHTFYTNLYNVAIGKLYSAQTVGFYSRGEQFPSIIVSNIDGAIQSVMLPALSSVQHDVIRMRQMVQRTITTTTFIIFPCLVGLAVIAEPLIVLILTDKWLAAVPFLQFFCLVYACYPIQTANMQAINALGRSDIFLKLEVINTCVTLVSLFITWQFGIYVVVIGLLCSTMLTTIFCMFISSRLLHYRFLQQCLHIAPQLIIASIMGCTLLAVSLLPAPAVVTMLIQILVGMIVYVGLAWLCRLESFTYMRNALTQILREKRHQSSPLQSEVEHS